MRILVRFKTIFLVSLFLSLHSASAFAGEFDTLYRDFQRATLPKMLELFENPYVYLYDSANKCHTASGKAVEVYTLILASGKPEDFSANFFVQDARNDGFSLLKLDEDSMFQIYLETRKFIDDKTNSRAVKTSNGYKVDLPSGIMYENYMFPSFGPAQVEFRQLGNSFIFVILGTNKGNLGPLIICSASYPKT